MEVRLKELRSGLGRKFFLLVFLAALVPMLLFASFAFNYVANLLLQQARQAVAQEAALSATVIAEQLLLAADQLQLAAANPEVLEFRPGNPLQQVQAVDWESAAGLGLALTPAVRQRLSQGQTQLLLDGEQRPVLLRLTAGNPERPLLLARLDPARLLAAGQRHSRLTACLYMAGVSDLVCTDTPPLSADQLAAQLVSAGQRGAISTQWQYAGRTLDASLQRLDLTPGFGGGQDWWLWASQPQAPVLDSLSGLQRALSLLVAVTVLLAALISVLLIRRLLRPLRQLMDATRAVANRHFEVNLAVTSSDELGQLAQAFTTMARQIGKQFQLLDGLSRIDQLILNVPDLDQVAQSSLSILQQLVDSDGAAVALRNPDDGSEIWRFGVQQGSARPASERLQLNEDESHWLGVLAPSHRASLSDARYLGWLWPGQPALPGGEYLPVSHYRRRQEPGCTGPGLGEIP